MSNIIYLFGAPETSRRVQTLTDACDLYCRANAILAKSIGTEREPEAWENVNMGLRLVLECLAESVITDARNYSKKAAKK